MKLLNLLFISLFALNVSADPGDEAQTTWDKVLKAHVTTSGVVDYATIKADPSFAKTVSLFSNQHPDASWSRNEEMAFWINVYNVFTVKLIIDNMPLKSIMDIDKPWDKKFVKLKDKVYSLNQIENEILRPKFKDARVHFAINCASYSCPKLANYVIRAESLDATLTKLTKSFLADTNRNKISPDKVELSQIFEWFADDFTTKSDLIGFINTYAPVQVKQGVKPSFITYSWALNGK